MALQVKNVSKRHNGTYIITVEETSIQIGTDERGDPIYQAFTVIHNPKDGDSVLSTKIEDEIKKYKAEKEELETVKSNITTVIEKIDSSKL